MITKSLILTLILCSVFILSASAEEIAFTGISLGAEASQLMKKFNIDPSEANSYSSNESCERIAAKKIISCVLDIANCKKRGSSSCKPDNFCLSPSEIQYREQEDRKCREEKKRVEEIHKWSENLTYAIRPRQPACATEKTYRQVINAYLDGNEAPLRKQIGFSCRIFENLTLAKIIAISDDGKLYHVQYQVPYSNYLSDGWLSRSSLISKDEYLKSRF